MGENNNNTCTYIYKRGILEGQQCQRQIGREGRSFCRIHDKRDLYSSLTSEKETAKIGR